MRPAAWFLCVVLSLSLKAKGLDLDCKLSNATTVSSQSSLEGLCSTSCVIAEEEESSTDLHENVPLAFGLVVAAGMSTAVGAALVFVDKCVTRTNSKMLAASLGFSGGVMMYVSFAEILLKSVDAFETCDCLWEHEDPRSPAKIMGSVTFFGGILFFFLLDFVVHKIKPHVVFRLAKKSPEVGRENDNGEESAADRNTGSISADSVNHKTGFADELMLEDAQATSVSELPKQRRPPSTVEIELFPSAEDSEEDLEVVDLAGMSETEQSAALNKMGIMTALAIGLHNFPEGLATFAGTLADPSVGVGLAVAVAIHNIPEGLCVSIPIYYATGSRWKGFLVATASGFAEIVGATLGYAFLVAVFSDVAYAILFGMVAGMMVAIVISELLPTAHRYDPKGKVAVKCFFAGMVVMALSLILFLL